MMIKRELAAYAQELFKRYPVLTVTGPRQSGKTTLVRACFGKFLPYANLEAPDVRRHALDDPRGFLAGFPDGAILGEIQRAPELASYIQVMVDDRGANGVFVLTGSHQFELHESVSQSLAGRTAILRLLPLTIRELSMLASDLEVDEMLVGGFMPRIYDQNIPHTQALSDYVATYVERDLRQLVAIRNLDTFERFLGLCAGRVGQLLNFSSLGNDAGVSHTTVREWVNLLQASYILFTLPPYFRNVGKRLVKSPKLYFHDVGLAAHLAGINSPEQMKTHPLRGGFFENLVVGEALKWQTNRGLKPSLHFYRDSAGNEVDLLFQESGHFLPVEIKSGQTLVRDFFKGLDAFRRVEPDLPYGTMLMYGGEQRRKQRDVTITTPRHFAADVGKLLEGHGAEG